MVREKNHGRKEISVAGEREEKEANEQVDEGGNGRDTSGEERGAREKRNERDGPLIM